MLTDQTSFAYIEQEKPEEGSPDAPLQWIRLKKDNQLMKMLKLNIENFSKAVVQQAKKTEKEIVRAKKVYG